MKDKLVKYTEISAYFIWEYTKHFMALDLWYCAEEIAFFFEKIGIHSTQNLNRIISLPKGDLGYIEFVRHISFRIYRFTMENDSVKNWYIAERLLSNSEWVDSIIGIALLYKEIACGKTDIIDSIRSERIRKYFTS